MLYIFCIFVQYVMHYRTILEVLQKFLSLSPWYFHAATPPKTLKNTDYMYVQEMVSLASVVCECSIAR